MTTPAKSAVERAEEWLAVVACGEPWNKVGDYMVVDRLGGRVVECEYRNVATGIASAPELMRELVAQLKTEECGPSRVCDAFQKQFDWCHRMKQERDALAIKLKAAEDFIEIQGRELAHAHRVEIPHICEDRDAAVRRAEAAEKERDAARMDHHNDSAGLLSVIRTRNETITDMRSEIGKMADRIILNEIRIDDAKKERDVLAEGVRLMSGDCGYDAAAIIAWNDKHGHLAKGKGG